MDKREFHDGINEVAAQHLGAIQILGYVLGALGDHAPPARWAQRIAPLQRAPLATAAKEWCLPHADARRSAYGDVADGARSRDA